MNIHIGLWIIPTILTLVMLAMMFRPWKSAGDWDYSFVFRVLWLIPILAMWVAFLTTDYLFGK